MMRIRRVGLVMALLWPGLAMPVAGQETATVQDASADVSAATGLLSPDELDALLAPVALYPDLLLAQVLFSTTYPIDVVKADRFLQKSAALPEDELSAAIAGQTWAEPVRAMAAGFPELIGRMAEHIDWTEQTGEAVVAQTDDVLDSLQRLRDQAQHNGYLEDNAAMLVSTDAQTGNISISSANPEVIYVPTYTETVYTQPAPATAVVISDGDDWGDALATGAIVFGSAMIINEIFDNDHWDDDWGGGYWHGNGGNNIDWNGDLNIDNGINVGGGGGINIGNGIGNGAGGIGNGGIGNGLGGIGNGGLGNGGLGNGGLGNGGLGNGGLGAGIGAGVGAGVVAADRARFRDFTDKMGAVDADRTQQVRDRVSGASDADRNAAREKIARRKAEGGAPGTLPAPKNKADRVGSLPTRPAGDGPVIRKPGAGKPSIKPSAKPAIKAPNISRPSPGSRPKGPSVARPSGKKAPAFKPGNGGQAKAAAARGKASKGHRRG